MKVEGLSHLGELTSAVTRRSQELSARPAEDRPAKMLALEITNQADALLLQAEVGEAPDVLREQCVEVATLALRLANALMEVDNGK